MKDLLEHSDTFVKVVDEMLTQLQDVSGYDDTEPYNIFTLYKIYKNMPKDIKQLKSIGT
jgi:hypothetical protein